MISGTSRANSQAPASELKEGIMASQNPALAAHRAEEHILERIGARDRNEFSRALLAERGEARLMREPILVVEREEVVGRGNVEVALGLAIDEPQVAGQLRIEL